ncbi:uncharacterized protein LOC119766986 [Culex quinquefasciatus]|uniref:uncharacterized protein LOC119766986 n=1 Tax=Culex quinquefasciatus TaxID=7176 RepID=UPI0018E3086F|nr:uncharacterized protein LOC119766986 [Culex quinquefasciatus]
MEDNIISKTEFIAARQILRCSALITCVCASVHDQQGQRRQASTHLGEHHPFPGGPASTRSFNHDQHQATSSCFGSPDGNASTVLSLLRSSLTRRPPKQFNPYRRFQQGEMLGQLDQSLGTTAINCGGPLAFPLGSSLTAWLSPRQMPQQPNHDPRPRTVCRF